MDSNFTYDFLGKDIEKNKLLLVGEIHGFDEPSKFDIDFFKFLHKNHNVNHYIAEVDFVQVSLLNDFLINGDENILKEIFKIRRSYLELEDKILSINIMINDSYMVMPSNLLPEFMRDEGKYLRMPVSADNIPFTYIVGIKDFKRMTPKH